MKSSMLIFSVFLIGTVSLFLGCGNAIEQKVQLVRDQQKELATNVFTLFIDDCTGIYPEMDQLFPNRITTPIAYITAEQLQDPFGKPGERYYYLPDRIMSNSLVFAIISRGPDRDLDSEKIPFTSTFVPRLTLAEGTEYLDGYGTHKVGPLKDSKWGEYQNPNHLYNVISYKDSAGNVIENTPTPIKLLPRLTDYKDKEDIIKKHLEWLAQNGAHQYDPTNGLISDGDIITIY